MERFMDKKPSAAEIRKTFLEFFIEQGHTFVPSASLVPGGDATLLFTNAGMVQFKDIFLGTDRRSYTRATNSQKCMRVAGKHNDLEDVGTDDTHHTFFEMLGNWSFGNYYKKEAITWAWQLLTDVWKLPKTQLYATCFKDDKGEIPTDEEAVENWLKQPGMPPDHVLYFGRKENFWEMADTGPCGPCSEIHIDRGIEYCNLQGIEAHQCSVNGNCNRFLELWNLVFIQYNRINSTQLNPLPATHVDTGMGFERIVSVLQDVDSNYKTDLFNEALSAIRSLTGDNEPKMLENFTPYRVIADHARAAVFLIADGVIPGNTGRNYICRMIIRRAARYGTKIGLHEPFLSKAANAFISSYSEFFPELVKNKQKILDNLTREEVRFAKTVESGTAVLEGLLDALKKTEHKILSGEKAFELYATYGLPFEITRDIAHEQSLDVDETGFRTAMDNHRLASGGGKAMGVHGGEDAEMYNQLMQKLIIEGSIGQDGVSYDPYQFLNTKGKLLAIIEDGQVVNEAYTGSIVSVVVPKTGFYIESGGQVSDTGVIRDVLGKWEIEINDIRKPAPGMIIHIGEVTFGQPMVNDEAEIIVDINRRKDIMRNHTATHLLQSQLHRVIGEQVHQAGSLVSPEKLRFDFNHTESISIEQLKDIEMGINQFILEDMPVISTIKSRDQAVLEGATALFGEKYGDVVRTISIVDQNSEIEDGLKISYELCGGTHLDHTGNIGNFIIISEGSVSAGIRRIEAVTGREANRIIAERLNEIRELTKIFSSSPEEIVKKTNSLLEDLNETRKQNADLKTKIIEQKFQVLLENVPFIKDVRVLMTIMEGAEIEILRNLCDKFREKFPSGIVIIGTILNDRPIVIAAVTDDINKRGIKAGDLVRSIAEKIGGSGGGKPTMAQAGGKDPTRLPEAFEGALKFIKEYLN
jgi:alanyl-tRNA synthetase